jgi:aarF domain-containing kinase
MKPLQDQCFSTALEDLKELFLSDVGAPLSTFFSTFDPIPIGVASLAQVHLATDRGSGRKVAVKIMHPDLEEFVPVSCSRAALADG